VDSDSQPLWNLGRAAILKVATTRSTFGLSGMPVPPVLPANVAGRDCTNGGAPGTVPGVAVGLFSAEASLM